ncbi:MAG: BMP family ABC transporter substrate-binding protein [Rhizobiales bacterium]|nr:BMP family ABC transporter substrate-binding protein [Hyphomicrobiales bacterium]NRB14550.1 BMP family ABC transporter substrate-binding protein [Hyphomicrobiales bacterium]
MSLLRKTIAVAAAISMSTMAMAAEKLKIGFVYVGDTGDGGWTFQHDAGRKALEAKFGDKVETIFVESVAEGPDSERVITRMARNGVGLIFTTSFGYMDPTIKVAAKFPDVKFEHATGYKQSDNVSVYSARFYEGRYIIGQIAAKESKTGIAGYVASVPIPEVVRGINAFLLGAQSVNPDFQVKVIWVNSWYDPGKEADAVKVFAAQGADIITQHTDSTAPMQIAEELGLKAFGQASDMAKFGPTAQLTAIVDDWAPYYIERTQAVLDGTWASTNTWDGIKQGMVHMTEFKNMAADTAAMAVATKEAIRSGELLPFAGPIYNQAGELVVKEGESLDDGALAGMDWYVKGVEGN